jgi:hypothetical protein
VVFLRLSSSASALATSRWLRFAIHRIVLRIDLSDGNIGRIGAGHGRTMDVSKLDSVDCTLADQSSASGSLL